MTITVADTLALLSLENGQITAPPAKGAAAGRSDLDVPQRSATIGEPVPVVFCRWTGTTGGVLINPPATEARFENSVTNAVTAYYHLVLSDGRIGNIEVRDVFQGQCRVGSFSQTYGRRAGTWTPENVIVARSGYTMPEASYYCGSIGNYAGISTLSYQITVADGIDSWKTQVHAFIRNGMEVQRLIEGTVGSSANFADLAYWAYQNSGQIPVSLLDTTALTAAANFLATNGFNCDIYVQNADNLPSFISRLAPYFLLAETRDLGKRGLLPLLQLNNDHTIKTTAISWEYTFTEDHVILDSFEITYTPAAERKPFCAQMIWRQQITNDFGIIRTASVRLNGEALNGPYEQHDLSEFCTVENHAVKVAAYMLARRRYVSHHLRFKCRPGAFNISLKQCDIVRVTLLRAAAGTPAVNHDYLYQVNRITKTMSGDVTLELTHYPVDALGRSLINVAVAAAVGTGVVLSSNKSGLGCDVNSSSDTTVPAETFTEQAATADDVAVSSDDEGAPGEATANPGETLDDLALPHDVYPAATNGPGTALYPGQSVCGGISGVKAVRWYRNGVLMRSTEFTGGVGVVTYSAPNSPPNVQAIPGGIIVAEGDAGVTYTSETVCNDGKSSIRDTTIGATPLNVELYYFRYRLFQNGSWSSWSTYYSYQYPPRFESPARAGTNREQRIDLIYYEEDGSTDWLITFNPSNQACELEVTSALDSNGQPINYPPP